MARNRVISAVLTLKDRDFSTNAKKATSALSDTERKALGARNTVSRFGDSASSSFRRVAESAAGIASAIGIMYGLNAAIRMVRGSLDTAFRRIDTMEQFDRTMTVLTGSTEAANAALERTDEIVKGTAYALDTAAKGVQDFVTRGMDVEKATSTIQAFTDAVSFYGDGSNEQLASVSDALAKMYTTGKVRMDQMNRLFDAGIDGVGMYATAVGRDTESVQEDLSSGAISAEEFIDVVSTAMMEGTNGVEKIAGAAQEAGASWGATWGNMRIYVARGVTSIIGSIDEMLTSNGLPDMRSMISNFGQTFEGVLNRASEKIPVVTGYLVGLYERSKPGIDWIKDTGMPAVQDGIGFATDKAREMYNFFKDNWSTIGPIVAGISATIAAYRIGIVAVTAATRTWGVVTSAVQVATALLNGTLAISPLGWVALAIGAVVAAGVALWQNWDWVREKASQLWQTLQDNPMLAIVAGPFGALITAGITIYNNFDRIKAAFDRFKNAISNFKLPNWVTSIGSTLSSAASTVGGWISGSHATGLNRVPYDGYIAELHKDEMVIPAVQSRRLRQQGVTIENIDQVPHQPPRAQTRIVKQESANDKRPVDVNFYFQNGDPDEIINKVVPRLKLILENM